MFWHRPAAIWDNAIEVDYLYKFHTLKQWKMPKIFFAVVVVVSFYKKHQQKWAKPASAYLCKQTMCVKHLN